MVVPSESCNVIITTLSTGQNITADISNNDTDFNLFKSQEIHVLFIYRLNSAFQRVYR